MAEMSGSNEPNRPEADRIVRPMPGMAHGPDRTGAPLPGKPDWATGRTSKPSGPNTRWPPAVQYLFVVILTVLFLLLAVSLQRHHFLAGELYERSHPGER